MSQQEFRAACEAAIKPYHDAKQDGPLLVSVRMNTAPSVLAPGTILIYPEYAAVIGSWPKEPQGTGYAEYHEFANEAVIDLVRHAKILHEEREAEPTQYCGQCGAEVEGYHSCQFEYAADE